MNRIAKIAALSTMSAVLSTGLAFAQDHDDHDRDHRDDHSYQDRRDNDRRDYDRHDDDHYVHHDEWRRGYHMRHEDWDRGRPVDWRAYHLRRPPRGYEWRTLDGNYVLANINTGIVNTVVVARR